MKPEDLLKEWNAQAPSDDFAERAVAAAMKECASSTPSGAAASAVAVRRGWRKKRWSIVGALAVAAAVLLYIASVSHPSSGHHIAAERIELSIDDRAVAVLEPGAAISWVGSEVYQDQGDVFYRVEPGDEFRVFTPAGVVEVVGTCFRVRVEESAVEGAMTKRDLWVLGAGVVAGAVTVVAVSEGRVHLSHASDRVEIGAGQTGKMDDAGALRLDEEGNAVAENDTSVPEADRDQLAGGIRFLQGKVRGLEAQKETLESELAQTRERLTAAASGDPSGLRDEFDLNEEDWAELAKDGTIKFRVPCWKEDPWRPGPEVSDKLGLSEEDGEVIHEAYKASNDRTWAVIRRLCIDAIGKPDVVDAMGMGTCVHVITDMARKQDAEASAEAMRQVAEMRAGQLPMPGPDDEVHPTVEVFLTLTGEMSLFQDDLSEHFGPEEANRIAFDDNLCRGSSTFGGPGPREK